MKVILVDAAHTLTNAGTGVFQEMKVLLDKLPNRKIVVTNASLDALEESFMGEDISYEVFTLNRNPDKSNPDYFNKLLKSFDLTSNDVVYFDHDMENVRAARTLGISSHYYEESKKDLAALSQFLSENL